MKIRPALFYFFFILTSNIATAQVDTLYICNPGDPIQLQAPAGSFVYQWTPATEMENPTIANPTVAPFVAQMYVVRSIPEVTTDNLISNPNFSDGNANFESEYDYVERINIQGVYGVNESAANLNGIYFEGCPDKTDGTGLMMVVDGSPTPNEKVWCQTIDVKPSTDYAFSAWLTSVNPQNPALLQFSINGTTIGNIFRAGSRVCEWRQFYEIWNAETATEAEICIVNKNTNPQGNDFALDDFAFYELDEVRYDTTLVLIEAIEAAQDRRVYFPNAFSPNYDGFNDTFRPYFGKGASSILSFQIFDRWGNLLFDESHCELNDEGCAWDGTLGGKAMPPGVYVYFSKVLFADQHIELINGDVILMR